MKKLSFIILIVLSAAFLALFTPFILQPSLYTKYNESSTLYHRNPAILSQYSSERSEDILTMMQELIDAPPSIVLNIKTQNFEEALWEFEAYKDKSRYFNDTVFTLRLDESVIGDFNRENQKILATLEGILSEKQFDEIGDLLGEQNDILEISSQLNLNTTRLEEMDSILKVIVVEDRKKQAEQGLPPPELSPPSTPNSVSDSRGRPNTSPSFLLSVSPSSGRYGDTLNVVGSYTDFRVPEMTLVLDGKEWKTLQPDKNGLYTTPLQIGTFRRGEHVIFAYNGALYSNHVSFTVIPAETVLTLEVLPGDRRSEIFCSGELHAGEIPVTDAPVRILVDDFAALVVMTNQTGFFGASLTLTQGNHTLQAIFDESAFPLNHSVSRMQSVMIESSVPPLLLLGIGAGFVVLAVLGGMYYIRWRKKESESTRHEMSGSEETMQEPAESSPCPPALTDILVRYQDFFDSGEWSTAAFLLYQYLIRRLIPFHGVSDPSARTPREFATLLSSTSFGKSFRSFIARYEEIRYGGLPLLQNDILLAYWKEVLEVFEVGADGEEHR